MSVPIASNISSATSVDESVASVDMDSILTSIKTLEAPELFKLLKATAAEAEKKSKVSKSTKAVKATKKAGSAPKGVVPSQLKKPRAWVEYTLNDAMTNGWDEFTVLQTKKDKATGTKTEEEIVFPGSVQNDDGDWVYEDSITDKTPKGRKIIHKEAMSLSKARKEAGHPSYAAFEASYVEEESDDSKSESTTTSKPTVVRKTAAEKAAETEAKKAAKEAEKEAKKAAKEAEKEAKKAAKEAEKEAKKAAKEAEKEAKKSAKKSAPAAPKVAPPKKAAAPAKATEEEAPKPAAKAVAVKPKTVKKVEEIPDDGAAHPWTYKGKKYLRTHDNEVWEAKPDNSLGKWAGVYDPAKDMIDTTAEEPEFSDSE